MGAGYTLRAFICLAPAAGMVPEVFYVYESIFDGVQNLSGTGSDLDFREIRL